MAQSNSTIASRPSAAAYNSTSPRSCRWCKTVGFERFTVESAAAAYTSLEPVPSFACTSWKLERINETVAGLTNASWRPFTITAAFLSADVLHAGNKRSITSTTSSKELTKRRTSTGAEAPSASSASSGIQAFTPAPITASSRRSSSCSATVARAARTGCTSSSARSLAASKATRSTAGSRDTIGGPPKPVTSAAGGLSLQGVRRYRR
mmetsp:Transcript_33333/g.116830  ORF Transcript_33333/g.116830 Transcript_33333/m.116830 type:complete len:208 (+) Transcript_33333:698-1321(+)